MTAAWISAAALVVIALLGLRALYIYSTGSRLERLTEEDVRASVAPTGWWNWPPNGDHEGVRVLHGPEDDDPAA